MSSVKICHMTSAHPKEDVRIFHKECTSLAQSGYEVYLVEHGETYDKNGVHIVGTGEMPRKRFRRMTEGTSRVYRAALAQDCDLYHFHDPELLPVGLTLKKKGKKVIFDIHENTAGAIREKGYIPSIFRGMLSKLYETYEAYCCRKLDALITVTPTQTESYLKINPNTVEVSNFPKLSEHYQEPSFKNRALVFAGAINSQWNHELIIRALRDIPDVEYVICGTANKYLGRLKTLPGWEKVNYKGRIPHEQVNNVMAECMIGVALLCPGRNTAGTIGTMGNTKIFEEMMAGLPVICTDFKLWRDFVDRYQCGICVDPSDEQAVIAAIDYLLNHPEEAKMMGKNGRRAVIEEFSWEVESKKLTELYRRLLPVS